MQIIFVDLILSYGQLDMCYLLLFSMLLDDCRYGIFVKFTDGQLNCDCPESCLYVFDAEFSFCLHVGFIKTNFLNIMIEDFVYV